MTQNVYTDSTFLVVETAFIDVADDNLDHKSHALRFAMLPEWADLSFAIHHLHLVAPAEHAKGILPCGSMKSLTFRFRFRWGVYGQKSFFRVYHYNLVYQKENLSQTIC